jgi:hypothetical protein
MNVMSHDEREQTLNQLLVEMDGFDATSGVVILAATNRPEILDPALLRPGRFDRTVLVDRPDLAGREQILKIHARNVKIDPAVDLTVVARMTPGLVGADLANIVNEAALLAVRAKRQQVTQADFEEAIEKSIAGLQKKNRLINPKEREIVAYHEVGHALVAARTPGSDPVQKITIVPEVSAPQHAADTDGGPLSHLRRAGGQSQRASGAGDGQLKSAGVQGRPTTLTRATDTEEDDHRVRHEREVQECRAEPAAGPAAGQPGGTWHHPGIRGKHPELCG